MISSLDLFEGEEYRIRAGIGPWILGRRGLAAATYGFARFRQLDR